MIHQTAVIHPKARLDSTVVVGPYAVIDERVVMGANCRIGPHVYITGITTIGANNQFHAGAVIGNAPQDLKYKGEETTLRIDDYSTFRENVTVNRSAKPGLDTIIGSHCLLMAGVHVGHDTIVGDHVIIANGALLGGHVTVEERAFISGNCLVHQFVRVGTLALMQGGSAISKDLPPYTIARGPNGICGLNIIGLRRAGYTPEQRRELRRLYALLFRGRKHLSHALTEAEAQTWSQPAQRMITFIRQSKRGVCQEVRGRPAEDSDAEE
jgi:UDP-N-acetylglucosamine acyltransferase